MPTSILCFTGDIQAHLDSFGRSGCTFSLRNTLRIIKSRVTLTSATEWGILLLTSFWIQQLFANYSFLITMCADSYLNECLVGSIGRADTEWKVFQWDRQGSKLFFFSSKEVISQTPAHSSFPCIPPLFFFSGFPFFLTFLLCFLVWLSLLFGQTIGMRYHTQLLHFVVLVYEVNTKLKNTLVAIWHLKFYKNMQASP